LEGDRTELEKKEDEILEYFKKNLKSETEIYNKLDKAYRDVAEKDSEAVYDLEKLYKTYIEDEDKRPGLIENYIKEMHTLLKELEEAEESE
jgi:hypothetical protein